MNNMSNSSYSDQVPSLLELVADHGEKKALELLKQRKKIASYKDQGLSEEEAAKKIAEENKQCDS